MSADYHIYPLGDHAITIEFGNTIHPEVNQRCLDAARRLREKNIPGVKDVVPAYTTATVVYDAASVSYSPGGYDRLIENIREVIDDVGTSGHRTGREMEIAACFDLSFAPDLEALASAKGISTEKVIDSFLRRTYRVYMIGFLPGFAYMGKVEDIIATPRRAVPHQTVNPGSIGIAGSQTGIYPLASPGGWNIIGRTPVTLFNPRSEAPCVLQAGDTIRFRSITIGEFNYLNKTA